MYYLTSIKFKNRRNQSMVLEISIMVKFRCDLVTERGHSRGFSGASNSLFLKMGPAYIRVFT